MEAKGAYDSYFWWATTKPTGLVSISRSMPSPLLLRVREIKGGAAESVWRATT